MDINSSGDKCISWFSRLIICIFKLKVLFFERMEVKPGCYFSLLFIYGDLLSIHSGMAIRIEGCKIFMNLENIVLTSLSIRIVGLEQPSIFMTSVIDLFLIKTKLKLGYTRTCQTHKFKNTCKASPLYKWPCCATRV